MTTIIETTTALARLLTADEIVTGVRFVNETGAWAELCFTPDGDTEPRSLFGEFSVRCWAPVHGDNEPLNIDASRNKMVAQRAVRQWLAVRRVWTGQPQPQLPA